MKLRKKDPWKSASEYSKNLSGLTINLLVEDIKNSLHFLQKIIKAKIIYQDPDFAAIEGFGSRWCIHSYHTYDKHPYLNIIKSSVPKGLGIELRVIGCDPDRAEERARKENYIILSNSMNKPHGMRECYILDNNGFCWVPSILV